MALVVGEARPLDFLEALDDGGRARAWLPRRLFGLMAVQASGGAAATIRTGDGRLCLIVGLYPDPARPGHVEAWLAAGPALAANLRPVLRQARQLLEAVGDQAAPLSVRALVASVAGGRIAAGLGFSAAGPIDTAAGPMQTFERRFP